MKVLAAFALSLVAVTFASAQNEQSPIVDRDISYKNWSLKDSRTDAKVDLRDLTKGKKLTVVIYYAPWCHNWQHDAPMVERIYEKYKDAGLQIVAVSEYDLLANTKTNLDQFKITFPAVYDSQSRDDREKTTHHDYRTSTGDDRKWGSPYYVFLLPSMMEKKGDTLTRHTFVINGEMIEGEGENFIREHLGLPAMDPKGGISQKEKDKVDPCDPDKPTIPALKKPN
ncbi:MAG: peroxiredoxin family protein [Pyrinomonadaceae bacterium]